MDYIKLKNVTYRYPLTKRDALKNITFTFEKGKFYGVIGENGGGKTTLCNLLRGLVPNFYKGTLTGDVLFDGTDIKNIDTDLLSTKIGYVFQNPFTQISGIKETVFEEISMGLENLGIPVPEIIERVINVIKLLKIEQIAKNNPNKLSGGQRQRVAFASIIVMNPEVLVIDEPTSQLDPQGTADVFDIINQLKMEGKTVILVEHKVDMIAEYADEVLVIQDGQLAMSGPTKEILTNKKLLSMGAILPEVALLGHDFKNLGITLTDIPITKEDCYTFIQKKWRGNDGCN